MSKRILNIVGIISSNGSVLSHVNYWGHFPYHTHSMAFPNKLMGRWRWLPESPEMILYMGVDDWDNDEKMLVYEHLRNILINHDIDVSEFDKYVTSYQLDKDWGK